MRTTAEAQRHAEFERQTRDADFIRQRIDVDRRRGKRDFLRRKRASDFTVAEIFFLLAGGDVWMDRLGGHHHSELAEDVFDQIMRGLDGQWPQDLYLSPWAKASGHRRQPCHDSQLCEATCANCNLYLCRVCGCSEGSLLPFCPNRRLTAAEEQTCYNHYLAGTGPFAKLTVETIDEAIKACGTYLTDDVGISDTSRLYDAVCELGRCTSGEEVQ